jgi:acid phosphatase family membrane protein YuiD
VQQLQQFFTNPMVIAPGMAWVAAQLSKTLIDLARNRRFNRRLLTASGGMPSAHSAFVCCLAATAGRSVGLSSPTFAVTFALAIVVMYDAAGVRRAVDKQSDILTHLLNHVPKTPDDFDRFLEELVGHTRLQVLAGAMLGILVAVLMS